MSTGNSLVDTLDTLKAKIEALSAQVKAADPRAVLEAARSGAGNHGPELREATRQAQEAAQAAREAADLERRLGRRLILGSLLAAFLGGAVAGGLGVAWWLAPVDKFFDGARQWAAANFQVRDTVTDLSGKLNQLAERVCPPPPMPQPPRSKRRE
jgi:ferric-dicitrate binding protein FerR (iron transport regulator)